MCGTGCVFLWCMLTPVPLLEVRTELPLAAPPVRACNTTEPNAHLRGFSHADGCAAHLNSARLRPRRPAAPPGAVQPEEEAETGAPVLHRFGHAPRGIALFRTLSTLLLHSHLHRTYRRWLPAGAWVIQRTVLDTTAALCRWKTSFVSSLPFCSQHCELLSPLEFSSRPAATSLLALATTSRR